MFLFLSFIWQQEGREKTEVATWESFISLSFCQSWHLLVLSLSFFWFIFFSYSLFSLNLSFPLLLSYSTPNFPLLTFLTPVSYFHSFSSLVSSCLVWSSFSALSSFFIFILQILFFFYLPLFFVSSNCFSFLPPSMHPSSTF